jgi:hypothetical protein
VFGAGRIGPYAEGGCQFGRALPARGARQEGGKMAVVRVPIAAAPSSEPKILQAVEGTLSRLSGGTQPTPSGEIVGQADEPLAGTIVTAVLSMALVVLGALLFDGWLPDSAFGQAPAQPLEGVTIFAVFFVAAQALERLMEPLSKVILPKETVENKKEKEEKALKDEVNQIAADRAEAEEGVQGTPPSTAEAERKAQELAKTRAQADARQKKRVILFWGLASVIAMLASATMKLYFLKTVGIANSTRWIEILATGLIIGAGTKPLHDLVKAIQAKSESAQTEAETQKSTTQV